MSRRGGKRGVTDEARHGHDNIQMTTIKVSRSHWLAYVIRSPLRLPILQEAVLLCGPNTKLFEATNKVSQLSLVPFKTGWET